MRKREKPMEKRKEEQRAKGNEESLNFSALKIAWNSSLAKALTFASSRDISIRRAILEFSDVERSSTRDKKLEIFSRSFRSSPAKIATFYDNVTKIFLRCKDYPQPATNSGEEKFLFRPCWIKVASPAARTNRSKFFNSSPVFNLSPGRGYFTISRKIRVDRYELIKRHVISNLINRRLMLLITGIF